MYSDQTLLAVALGWFLAGFLAAKIHRAWVVQRFRDDLGMQAQHLSEGYERDRKSLRDSLEGEIMTELGLGGCCNLAEAAEAIRCLRAGKPLRYPPPYPDYVK